MTPLRVSRVVFDTNVLISTILFRNGQLAWLRHHWSSGACLPLASTATLAELRRVLVYSKFNLAPAGRLTAIELYLPFCEIVEVQRPCPTPCRDPKDQPFLDLAHCGAADILVSGDDDLLSLNGQTSFAIETPAAYRARRESRKR